MEKLNEKNSEWQGRRENALKFKQELEEKSW